MSDRMRIIEQKFYEAIKSGVSREDAAVQSGLPIPLMFRWLERAEQGRDPFLTFFTNVRKLESLHKTKLVQDVMRISAGDEAKGIKPNWSAGAWMLERRWSDEFGRVDEDKVVEMITRKFGDIKDGVTRVILRYVPDEAREQATVELEELFE